MPKTREIAGLRFGKLVVIERQGLTATKRRQSQWLCHCDCGRDTLVSAGNLNHGVTKSCGCLRPASFLRPAHGMIETSEYRTWSRIKDRCLNSNNSAYPNYGGRGISICDRWRDSFQSFLADMGTKPTPAHTIERDDNNGNYEPDNCRWATRKEQGRNRRVTRHVLVLGRKFSLSEAIERFAFRSAGTVHSRIRRGWPIEKAILT